MTDRKRPKFSAAPADATLINLPTGAADSVLPVRESPDLSAVAGPGPDPEATIVLPDDIGQVQLEFAEEVNRSVRQSLVDWLEAFICCDIAPGFSLLRLHISSANDSHKLPSRHMMGRAVDISRVNGKHMSVHYPRDREVKAITDALIVRARICGPTFVAREIFGPGDAPGGVKLKLGLPKPGVSDHASHIHFSEGDRASVSGCPWDEPLTV